MHPDAPDLRRRDACRLGLRLLALGALAGVAGLLGARRVAGDPPDGAAGSACGTPTACAGCPLRQRCGSAAAPAPEPTPGARGAAPEPTPGGGPRR